MDHRTSPISRNELRGMAEQLREELDYDRDEPFDPVAALDKFCNIYPQVGYDIVEDNELPREVPSCCATEGERSYLIKIKNNVYENARKFKVGECRMDITHEIAHAYLCIHGYGPISLEEYEEGSIRVCESMEWQAKALAGEIMIPYEATENMSKMEICLTYRVSDAAAMHRCKMKKKGDL